jgi:hypothetical protein
MIVVCCIAPFACHATRFTLIYWYEFTLDEITRLSPDERLALISHLWDSLEDTNFADARAAS